MYGWKFQWYVESQDVQDEDRSMIFEAQGQEMREERWKGKRVGQDMENGGRVWKGRKLGFQARCLVRCRSLGFRSAITRPNLGMKSRYKKWKGRGVKVGLEKQKNIQIKLFGSKRNTSWENLLD